MHEPAFEITVTYKVKVDWKVEVSRQGPVWVKLEGMHVCLLSSPAPCVPHHLVSGCENSHCPVFHFELGVHVSSVLRVKPGPTFAWLGAKQSETAERGTVSGPHQRRWPGLPDPGLRPASPQLPLGQNAVSLFRFKFRLTSFQVSLLSSSHRTFSTSLCELVSPVRRCLGNQWSGGCTVDRTWVCGAESGSLPPDGDL